MEDAHEQSNEVLLELATQGVITVYDMVTDELALRVRDRLMVAQANRVEELEVRIQTDGGDISAGLTIHDMIRAAPVKKRRGLVTGQGHSIGAIILQACDVREAMRYSRFLIHQVILDERLSLSTLRDSKRMKKIIGGLEIQQRGIEMILARCTNRKISEIRRECAKETEMSSEEALEFGLIDAIRD